MVEDPGCSPYRLGPDGDREYLGYLAERPVRYGRFVSVYDPTDALVADNVWRDWTRDEQCEPEDYADRGWGGSDR